MTKKRWWLAIGGGVVAAAALAVGLTLALTGGGSSTPKQLSHADYEALWDGTHVGDAKQAVLARWPKVPDQHYVDNLKDDCYEWDDVPVARLNNLPANLYNLCFKDGVLRMKILG
jgi:hypothetical protein